MCLPFSNRRGPAHIDTRMTVSLSHIHSERIARKLAHAGAGRSVRALRAGAIQILWRRGYKGLPQSLACLTASFAPALLVGRTSLRMGRLHGT